jgi:transposase
MRPYSYDLRERVVNACLKGYGTRKTIAQIFNVSTSWIRRLFQRQRQSGSFAALPAGGGAPPKFTARHEQLLIKAVKKHPDATLDQLCQACGNPVSRSAIGQHLQKLKLGRKKKRLHASERDRPEVQAQRKDWQARMSQINAQRFVFVDEFGAQTTMTPLYGRAPKGERVEDNVPADHWHTTTLVGAVRLGEVFAPMVLDGPMDGASFRIYVEQVLLPEVKPGDIVIWDNLSTHQAAKADDLMNQACADLKPLPPHSPDFNPIEQVGSKVKEFLRRTKARTVRALTKAIGLALDTITPEDIRNWYEHCGYRYTFP